MLRPLETAQAPETYLEQPFEWSQTAEQAPNPAKDVHPPIARLLSARPWLLTNLGAGRLPEDAAA